VIEVKKMSKKQTALWGANAKSKLLYLFVTAALVIGAGFFFNWTYHTKIIADAITHQPERYTELFFTDPNDLPSTAISKQQLPVQFTIHNVEARNMTYTYDIDFTSATGKVTLLSQRSLSLASTKAVAITDTEKLPKFTGRVEISVILLHQPEAIHLWLEDAS
jgi:hypothetical protein